MTIYTILLCIGGYCFQPDVSAVYRTPDACLHALVTYKRNANPREREGYSCASREISVWTQVR